MNIIIKTGINFLPTFFYLDIMKPNYIYSRKFTKYFNIFEIKLLIPININNNHWILFFFDWNKQSLTIFDSYESYYEYLHELLKPLWSYFCNENRSVYNGKYPMRNVNIYIEKNIPKQSNSYDCGVFVCIYALYITEGFLENFNFNQEDLRYFRKIIFIFLINVEDLMKKLEIKIDFNDLQKLILNYVKLNLGYLN